MSVWTKVEARLPFPPGDWSPLIEVFARYGIPGTVQTDRPPTLSGYFAEESPLSVEELSRELAEAGCCQVSTSAVPDENWAESWKQFFKPRRVGDRFVVRPTWESTELEAGALEIVLDPGQAFGTGDHPTTRLCLELLEGTPLVGKRFADIGCGSGILTIAASLLGATDLHAVDIDAVSVNATVDNLARAEVMANVAAGNGFEPLDGMFDVVVSNIISAALIALANEAAMRLNPGGTWIASGIIEANWPDVLDAVERSGFRLACLRQEGEWIAAALER